MSMKGWVYNLVGGLFILFGIIGGVLTFLEGGFNFNLSSHVFSGGLYTFLSLPIFLFLVVGGYYLFIGLKNLEVNRLISSSLVLQIISFTIIILGLVVTFFGCSVSSDGLCVLSMVPFFVVGLILVLVGILLIIEGFFFGNKEISRCVVGWSIFGFLVLVSIVVTIYLMTIG